jgi:hypothetical protein
MKNYVIAPALAALAMFVFGAIFWMSPFPYKVLRQTTDDPVALAMLGPLFPVTGTYLVPGPHLDRETMTELTQTGPSVLVQFVAEGHAEMEPGVFVKGYIHYFVVALLLAILLQKIAPVLKGYTCCIVTCAWVGLLGGLLLECNDPIWWHHPWAWHLVNLLYGVLAFAVAGLVLGRFVKPGTPPAT